MGRNPGRKMSGPGTVGRFGEPAPGSRIRVVRVRVAFRKGDRVLSDPLEAWDLLCAALSPLGEESLPLASAGGRYLAESVRADRNLPPADRSTVDGFAVRSADAAAAPVRLRVAGELAAGTAPAGTVGPGECVRIFTGANLPAGADAVVPVEDAEEETGAEGRGAWIRTRRPVSPAEHLVRRGEHARAGQVLLPAGARLGPGQVALAAACGCHRPRVHRLPVAAVLVTGSELLSPDAPAPGDHEVRDSNGPLLAAALAAEGFPCGPVRRVPDDLGGTVESLRGAAASAGALLVTGGASVGKYDFLERALAELGAAVHYHGVRMKPGKPQLFATLPGGAAVFGLPGNPLSALVGLHEFVLPGLRLLAGCPPAAARRGFSLPLASAATPAADRWRLLPARLEALPRGTAAAPLACGGSSDLVAGALADGAVLIPPGTGALPPGTPVEFRPWGSPP